MKNSSKEIDRKILKTLEPLNKLNPILLDELAAKSVIDEVFAGKIICRHGDKDSRQIYLLSGQIEVATPGETKIKLIKSKSALKNPIAKGSPHKATLKAKINSVLLYIDTDLLELLMSSEPEPTTTYEVAVISTYDWMLTFLQSPVFLKLPTKNIQKLLTHMDQIPVKKDQVVIQQGATDDNYYIIKSGSCSVQRQPHQDSANVLLAVLPTGSGFGEEALISNGTRNATITMREDGTLMRLKKKYFVSLLITPLISYFEHNETQQKLDAGCVAIDVRTEHQSKQQPLDGAVNIPLSMLRLKFDSLNTEHEYLVVCDDGSQSAAAAFLMIQNGMKCSVLKNGINHSAAATKADVLVELANEAIPTLSAENGLINFKSISIPSGVSNASAIDDTDAERKAIAIKEKLAQSQKFKASQAAAAAKKRNTNSGTILEGEEDLFIFQTPKTPAHTTNSNIEQPVIAHRTKAESAMTQISIESTQSKSVVIYPQQEQKYSYDNNPFLNNDKEAAKPKAQVQQLDKESHARQSQTSKSNTIAIAASFLLILAGAVFTLHATNTLKVQSIAALFNSGNDTVQTTATAKAETIRRIVLRADTKVNVKKKVTNKVDNIMQDWKDVLSEAQDPQKSKK